MSRLAEIWQQMGHSRLLVIGDLLLDRYIWGDAERISPEAPVLVLREQEQDVRPGGAANVASFLRGFDAEVLLVGVIGDDAEGRMLSRLLCDLRVDTAGVVAVPDRPTTSKQRFVGRTGNRQPHQLLRVDRETREAISAEIEAELIEHIRAQLPRCDVVLISDYAKGVCTPSLLRRVIGLANQLGKPVLIDPSRGGNYARYADSTLVAPNRLAAELWSGQSIETPEAALEVASKLHQELNLECSVITLDRDGMAVATEPGAEIVPCRPRSVCDVTGAGDMVLSVLGLASCARVEWVDALALANAAAGLEVERFGVEPLSRDEVAAELTGNAGGNGKLSGLADLLPRLDQLRRAGRRIVFTNGCFDLLHVGHVTLLQEAARCGDMLIVAINSDSSVRTLKGPERPVITEGDRARMLAALDCVDHVLVYDDATPERLLGSIRPDVLIKGGTTGHIVGRDIVEGYGGQVLRASELPGQSTSAIVSRLQATAK